MLNGKALIVFLIVGFIKKYEAELSEYFPKRKPLEGSVKVELNFSNYATKED